MTVSQDEVVPRPVRARGDGGCQCTCDSLCPDQPETPKSLRYAAPSCSRPAAYLFTWVDFVALELCSECVTRRRTRKSHLEHLFTVRSL